jgi:hypothetical protein
MTPLDPDTPLPVWRPAAGQEREPERVDVLIEQLRSLWKRHPSMRLGQRLVNIAGLRPNPLFNVEDHVLSEKICAIRETGAWLTEYGVSEGGEQRRETKAEPERGS